MSNTIKIKRSLVPGKVPAQDTLEAGELAVNLEDKKLFVGDINKTAIELSGSEKGGVAHSDTTSYKKGDVVSHNDKAYVAKSDIAPGAFDSAKWTDVGSGGGGTPVDEKGGIAHDPTKSYTAGDIVSVGNKAYIAKANIAAKPFDPSEWDISGKDYDATNLLLDGYSTPATSTPIGATDPVQAAIGKLDKSVQDIVAIGGEANVQSDWDETTSTNDAFIKNKPDLTVIDGGAF